MALHRIQRNQWRIQVNLPKLQKTSDMVSIDIGPRVHKEIENEDQDQG